MSINSRIYLKTVVYSYIGEYPEMKIKYYYSKQRSISNIILSKRSQVRKSTFYVFPFFMKFKKRQN